MGASQTVMTKPRRRKCLPYDPAGKVHDRKSTDLLRNADVASLEVDDPYEPGSKLIVLRSLRDDPFARMHANGDVDQAQYEAGLAFQRDFENAERGPRAVDPSREYVDGGVAPEPITESQRRSARRLAEVYRRLGQNGSAILHDVIVHKLDLQSAGRKRGMVRGVEMRYLEGCLAEGLDKIAEYYGMANGPRVEG